MSGTSAHGHGRYRLPDWPNYQGDTAIARSLGNAIVVTWRQMARARREDMDLNTYLYRQQLDILRDILHGDYDWSID